MITDNIVLVVYCFVMLLFYLFLAYRHFHEHKRWTYNVISYIGLSICFLIYLSNHEDLAWCEGIGTVVFQVICDFIHTHHEQSHIKFKAHAERHNKYLTVHSKKKNNHYKNLVSDK